jgi:Uma2 family endonuclease
MASLPITRYTLEQYLAIERAADHKSEYIAGEMVAMSGVSLRHSVIKSNVEWHLRGQIGDKPCRTHSSDLRVHVGSAFFYPDIVVVCGEPKLLDDTYLDTLLNPSVVIEVLSKSTEGYDRGIKFMRYAQIETLTDYILVAQDTYRIEHFVRLPDGEWPTPVVITNPKATLKIESLGCSLSIADIYRGIDLSAGD